MNGILNVRRLLPLAVIAAMVLPLASAQTVVKVGEKVPDSVFKQLLNNDGRMSLGEYRGNVILLDWWGQH